MERSFKEYFVEAEEVKKLSAQISEAYELALENKEFGHVFEEGIFDSIKKGWNKLKEGAKALRNHKALKDDPEAEKLANSIADGLEQTEEGGTVDKETVEGLRQFLKTSFVKNDMKSPEEQALVKKWEYIVANNGKLGSGDSKEGEQGSETVSMSMGELDNLLKDLEEKSPNTAQEVRNFRKWSIRFAKKFIPNREGAKAFYMVTDTIVGKVLSNLDPSSGKNIKLKNNSFEVFRKAVEESMRKRQVVIRKEISRIDKKTNEQIAIKKAERDKEIADLKANKNKRKSDLSKNLLK